MQGYLEPFLRSFSENWDKKRLLFVKNERKKPRKDFEGYFEDFERKKRGAVLFSFGRIF